MVWWFEGRCRRLWFQGFLLELKWPNACHIFTHWGSESKLNLGIGLGFNYTTFGSWMKLWPDLALGGNSLEQESFKYLRMVVFPVLLGPTIGVKRLKKVMMCLVSRTKLQIPFISILSTVLFLASSLLLVYWCLEDEREREERVFHFSEWERLRKSQWKGWDRKYDVHICVFKDRQNYDVYLRGLFLHK